MQDYEIQQLIENGFVRFISIKKLRERPELLSDIPQNEGVYVSLRSSKTKPHFLKIGTGGHYNGDPNVSISTLQTKWLEDSSIMYIGESENIQERISLYLRFGQGETVRHWGGRYVWQLEDAYDLVICWKVVDNAKQIKEQMLLDFKAKHGKLPFANMRL